MDDASWVLVVVFRTDNAKREPNESPQGVKAKATWVSDWRLRIVAKDGGEDTLNQLGLLNLRQRVKPSHEGSCRSFGISAEGCTEIKN